MIEELHRFILVANNGNLTKTAEKIFITQSALSQSIKRLEKSLGIKLFIHKGKNLVITQEGKTVKEIGEKIVELWGRAQQIPHSYGTKPTYTIGLVDNAAIQLAHYFQQTIEENKISLELKIDATNKLLMHLRLGFFDMAICIMPLQPIDDSITLVHTFTETLIPVSSREWKEPIEKIPFILYNKSSHTRDHIDLTFIQAGIKPKIFADSTSVTFMKELARLECGVALLPENVIREDCKQKLLIKQKLPLSWQRTYGIYLKKDGRLTNESSITTDIITTLANTMMIQSVDQPKS